MKQCTKCKEWKDEVEFSKDKRKKSGLDSWCKECKNKQYRKWHEENKEYKRAQNRKWHEENKEYKRAQYRRWYEENKFLVAQYHKKYERENRDKINERKRKYRELYKERDKEKRAEERRKYREKVKKEWLKIIKEKFGSLSCSKCGYDKSWVAIDFHHLDPKIKEYNLAKLIELKPTPKRIAELDKGILLCKNCHALVEWGNKNN